MLGAPDTCKLMQRLAVLVLCGLWVMCMLTTTEGMASSHDHTGGTHEPVILFQEELEEAHLVSGLEVLENSSTEPSVAPTEGLAFADARLGRARLEVMAQISRGADSIDRRARQFMAMWHELLHEAQLRDYSHILPDYTTKDADGNRVIDAEHPGLSYIYVSRVAPLSRVADSGARVSKAVSRLLGNADTEDRVYDGVDWKGLLSRRALAR